MADNEKPFAGTFTYSHRLVAVLTLFGVMGVKLYFNAGTSDSLLLMVAISGIALPTGAYFAVRSIVRKESGRWIGWGYFLVLIGVTFWAIFSF